MAVQTAYHERAGVNARAIAILTICACSGGVAMLVAWTGDVLPAPARRADIPACAARGDRAALIKVHNVGSALLAVELGEAPNERKLLMVEPRKFGFAWVEPLDGYVRYTFRVAKSPAPGAPIMTRDAVAVEPCDIATVTVP